MIRLCEKSRELMTEIEFQFDCDEIGNDKCIVNLCPQKIRRYWEDDNCYQRSPNVTSYKHDLPWDAEPKRLLSLVKAANTSITVPPIQVHAGYKGGLSFPDGRHRSVIAMINNHSVVKAEVSISEKDYILNLLAA